MRFNICTLGSCASIFLWRFYPFWGARGPCEGPQRFHSFIRYHSSVPDPNDKLSAPVQCPFTPRINPCKWILLVDTSSHEVNWPLQAREYHMSFQLTWHDKNYKQNK